MSSEAEQELKRKFAVELLRTPGDPLRAASVVYPGDFGLQCFAANNWPNDEYVKTFLVSPEAAEAISEYLPTKEAFAMELLRKAQSIADPKAALDFYKLFSETVGYTGKAATTNVNVDARNQVANNHHVMVVHHHGNDDDWAARAEKQQARLIQNARAS